jgi:hypothetical protein
VSIVNVVNAPLSYAVVHRETRRALVPRFPYGVFFRIVEDTIAIVACYHLHRRPASWKRRQ